MAFFKFRWLREREQGDAPGLRPRVPSAESVEFMRRRARHRLIGAAVLVLMGVLGFPLLFDTQPRPIPVDIPIEIPDRAKVAPLVVPSAPTAEAQAPKVPGSALPIPIPVPPTVSLSRSAEPSRPVAGLVDGEELVAAPTAVPKPAPKPAPKPEAKPTPAPAPAPKPERAESKPESKPVAAPKPDPKPEPRSAPVAKPEPRPVPKPEPKEAKPEPKPVERKPSADEAARAKALLEGGNVVAKSTDPARPDAGDRAIVQVGAFADPDKAREVRSKLERAGLKAFTQVVETKDGKRTRVRVGPFSSRAEADKAAARVRSLDLSASVIPQ